jgi:hypothetical protein
MNRFLELSFRNYCRNGKDDFMHEYEDAFEPFLKELRKILNPELCAELEDLLSDCKTEAMNIAGVAGMQLAINVLNGTDKQPIE